ncbi:MAG TPA: D-2-hydroxyacid dehydrogenase [Phycisphaerae bacterium]|nr:D-2-hydroxyacid dehydrogenase [Phycisphaerae bacterium]HRR86864.1 D-2-hydroxyacid dehydrogenase [Phycisphaerae bacterium]
MRIVVLDGHTMSPGDNPWDEVAALGELTIYERSTHGQLIERAGAAEIIVTNKVPVTAADLDQLVNLKMIAVTATGYNVVDVEAARARGIPVCNVPVYATQGVAQFTFALLLELCHHVGAHDASVKQGAWTRSPDFSYCETPQIELADRVMGVIGYGRIGRQAARIARAFDMKVMACDKDHAPGGADGEVCFVDMRTVFSQADVVSLHCPQTSETAGLVNAERLGLMKSTAFLINTARGGLVVERDLADALNKGRIAGAAVDVVAVEPIREDNPLLTARNIIITPHMAWAGLAARKRLMAVTAENIRAFQRGKPVNVVN